MKTEEVTCIMCPRGCKVQVDIEDDEIRDVRGYACPNGEEYAIEEIKCPNRTVMSVVRCEDCRMPTVTVKTENPVPKDKIDEVMEDISDIKVSPPVEIGEIIKENVAGTGVDVIVTRPAEEC